MRELAKDELVNLIRSVFPRFEGDRALAILVDVPGAGEDHNLWKQRREMARAWAKILSEASGELGYDMVSLIGYPSVGSHNADLPKTVYLLTGRVPDDSREFNGDAIPLEELLAKTQVLMAPTEYSTTAPLKVAGRKYGFRAATMAGFSQEMLPALRLDYGEIGRRVDLLVEKLNRAQAARVVFSVDSKKEMQAFFDLRFRPAHASSGRFPKAGTAGNLPSGEAYIVPYEGEKQKSETSGTIPVQFADDLVLYRIEGNRAVSVDGEGEALKRERALIASEPAYCNIAELGFGVLGNFGLAPIGEVLLDEKLGFHIAFGRSDHFGGIVGPGDFSSPKAVVHIDRIYIPATQPRVLVKSVELEYPDNKEQIIRDGDYIVF